MEKWVVKKLKFINREVGGRSKSHVVEMGDIFLRNRRFTSVPLQLGNGEYINCEKFRHKNFFK